MILWNTCNRPIEGKYDVRIYCFAPKERKKIYDKAVIEQLLVSMEMYGLVALGTPEGGDEFTKDEEQKAYIRGIKNRWKYCDWVVRNWKSMNKDREGMKMASAPPTQHEENCCIEAQELLDELNQLDGKKIDKMQAYLEDTKTAKAVAEMEGEQDGLVTSGVKIEMKQTRGRLKNVDVVTADKDKMQV